MLLFVNNNSQNNPLFCLRPLKPKNLLLTTFSASPRRGETHHRLR